MCVKLANKIIGICPAEMTTTKINIEKFIFIFPNGATNELKFFNFKIWHGFLARLEQNILKLNNADYSECLYGIGKN